MELGDLPSERFCAVDGKLLPPHQRVGRPPRFCSEGCRHEARKQMNKDAKARYVSKLPKEIQMAKQEAERFRYQHGLTRRRFITGVASGLLSTACLELRPLDQASRHEQAWTSLSESRKALLLGDEMAAKAALGSVPALLLDDASSDARRLKIYFESILRDLGAPGRRDIAVPVMRSSRRLICREQRESMTRL